MDVLPLKIAEENNDVAVINQKDFIGFSKQEIEMIIKIVEVLWLKHELPLNQRFDFTEHLNGVLNNLNLSQGINTEIVTNYVHRFCPICRTQFFGSSHDLYCRSKSCEEKWVEENLFDRIKSAQQAQIEARKRKGEVYHD